MVFVNTSETSEGEDSLASEFNDSIGKQTESKLPSSLAQGLDANRAWLQKTWEDIFSRYGKEFDSGDEVDIMTGEIIVDRGHLRRTGRRGFGRGLNLLNAEKNPMFFSKSSTDLSLKNSKELPPIGEIAMIKDSLLSSPKLSKSFASKNSPNISEATEILSHWGTSADSSVLIEKAKFPDEKFSYTSADSIYSGWESNEDTTPFNKVEPAIVHSFSKLESSQSFSSIEKGDLSKESANLPLESKSNLPTSPILSNIIAFDNFINDNQTEDFFIDDEDAISSVSSFSLDLDPETIIMTPDLHDLDTSSPPTNIINELITPKFKTLNESTDPWNLDYVFENFDVNGAKNYDNSYEINPEDFESDDSNHLNMSFNNLSIGKPVDFSIPSKSSTSISIIPDSKKNAHDNNQVKKHLIIDFEDSQLISNDPDFSSVISPKNIQSIEHLESSDSPSSNDNVSHSSSYVLCDIKPIVNTVTLKRKLQLQKNSISKSRVYSSADIITVKMNSTTINENLDLFEFLCPEDYAYFHKS